MKNYKQEHELMRQRVWSDVWSRVASSNKGVSGDICTAFADHALKEFDKRFNIPSIFKGKKEE